jgi:hypothetical protein
LSTIVDENLRASPRARRHGFVPVEPARLGFPVALGQRLRQYRTSAPTFA